jgi:multidrug efflux pump subunit AcrA (membrane-fusion protein)
MTGSIVVDLMRNGLGIPDAGVDVLSPTQGLVFVVDGAENPAVGPDATVETRTRWVKWSARSIRIGSRSDGWTEVVEGLNVGDEILLGGHGTLQMSDRVKIVPKAVKP